MPLLTFPFLRRAAGVLAAFALSLGAHAQAPTWQQAVAVGQGSGSATVLATTTDAAGNVYLTGVIRGTVSFGSQTLVSNGQEDVFVTKWSSASSSFVWALGAGGSRSDVASGVAVSGSSVYVTGAFVGAVGFGSTTLPNNNANGFTADVVVAKLTDAGSSASWTWALQAGGTFDDFSGGVAVSGSNVYISGTSQGRATFGGSTITNPGANAYVAKLTDAGANGAFGWVQSSTGTGLDRAPALAVSGPSVYVAGSFAGPSITFGSTTLNNTTMSLSNLDLFVAKLTDAGPTGSFAWARGAGGSEFDEARALAVNGPNVYVTGDFRSPTLSFDATTLTNANTNPGQFSPDVFVAKLSDAGSSAAFTWAQQAGGPDIDEARALAVSGSSVYVTGFFYSATAGFGATTLANTSTNSSSADVFVARLIDAGATSSFAWAQQAGSATGDFGRAIAVRGSTVYVAGEAGGTARFGSQTLPGPASAYSSFLASFTDPALLATAAPSRPLNLRPYPNPAHGLVQLPSLAAGSRVQLFDALGRVARETTISAAAEVSVRGLAPGLYTLRATDKQGRQYAARVAVE